MAIRSNCVAITLLVGFVGLSVFPTFSRASEVSIDATTLIPRVAISFTPRSGTFIEGSTFEVPIIINTYGVSVNAVEIKVSYDPSHLAIVLPSGGKSIIGVWAEPPSFDNTNGTASYVGIIPDGIVTDAGLVGAITFKAIRSGTASLAIQGTSNIFLNDGVGSPAEVDRSRATYTIIPRPVEGVEIYSETHPSQSEWYNNNSPIISWDTLPGAEGYSVVLDTYPATIPSNEVTNTETSEVYRNLGDGLWYFHVKALKDGGWGNTSHFLIRIDTSPPADFKPEIDFVLASAALVKRALVTFFTTDALSGLDRFEVGVIDKRESTTVSPVFIETESPFQVPLDDRGNVRVIVRAIDNAGNIRDESIDVRSPLPLVPSVFEAVGIAFALLVLIVVLSVLVWRRRTRGVETRSIPNTLPSQDS